MLTTFSAEVGAGAGSSANQFVPKLIKTLPLNISVLTEIKDKNKIPLMKLNPTTEKFILHWGEMGTKWGVNRTVAQIHALLYILGRPMNAEEITETLGVARSNVSNSIKELQNLKLVHTVHILGDRRDHFETSDDVWTLFRTIAEMRMQREIEPTRQFLQSLIDSSEFSQENETAKQRIRQTHDFINTLTIWANEMLKLSTSTMVKILKIGAGIQKFFR